MPNIERCLGRKAARRANKAAEASAAAGGDAPDAGLIAPDEDCSVCLNAFEWRTIMPCSHWFCKSASFCPPCLNSLKNL